MKENKGFVIAVAAVLLLVAAALIWRYGGSKTAIDREIACIDQKSGQDVTVKVKGTYYSYWLRNDLFDGLISISGEGIGDLANERTFKFRNGETTFIEKTSGQPYASAGQTGMFATVWILAPDFAIYSK